MDIKEILKDMSVQEMMGAYRVLSAIHYSEDLFRTISRAMDDIMDESDIKLERSRVEADRALEELARINRAYA